MHKMHAAAIALALSGALTASAASSEFDIQIDNFVVGRGISQAVLKVTNQTGRAVSLVFIDCVFMDKAKKAIDIGKASFMQMAAGEVSYDKAAIATDQGVEFVQCSVRSFR